MKKLIATLAGAALMTIATAQMAEAQVLFWSNQAAPVEEAQKVRDTVVKNFPGGVDFEPQDPGPFITRIQAEEQAGKGTIGVIGGLHGDLANFANDFVDLSDVDLGAVKPRPATAPRAQSASSSRRRSPSPAGARHCSYAT